MIRSLFMLVLALLPVAALVQSQPGPKPWPREVQAVYDELKAECRAGGGKFVPDRADFAVETEVTGDGKPDWVVEYSAAHCSNQGYSAWCGTAGCMITILGSGRGGLTEIFSNNVRGWEAVKLDGGRTGLGLSVHGTVCGSVGADMCLEVLRWDGRKWALAGRRRGTHADLGPDSGEPALPPSPGHDARWQFGGSGAGAVAAVTGHPQFAALGLRCQPGGGLYMSVVPTKALRLPPAGRPLLIGFRSHAEFTETTQQLMLEPGKPDFSGTLDPATKALLTGADTDLAVYASTDGGDEWREVTYLSLAGSTAAIRSLERQCPQAAAASSDAKSGQSRAVPLPVGYYVDMRIGTCAKPFADGTLYLAEDRVVSPHNSCKFTSLKMVDGQNFRQTESCPDEDGRPTAGTTSYRVTGPRSFAVETYSEDWTWCPAARLPAKARFYKGAGR